MFIPFGYTANITEGIYYVPLHVYVRKPSLTTSTQLYPLNFLSDSCHNFHFLLHTGRTSEQGEMCRALCSTTSPPLRYRPPPPQLPLIPCQDKRHAAPRHSVSPHPLEERLPCISRNIFPCTHLVLILRFSRPAHICTPDRSEERRVYR